MNQLQLPWVSLRAGVTADDPALAAFDYDAWPASGAIEVSAQQHADSNVHHLLDARRLWLAFYGKAQADETCAYKLYTRRRTNGPILLLAQGVLTLGTLAVTKDPITKAISTCLWADTITITGGLWSDLAPLIVDSGNNRIALLRGRNEGLRDYYVEFDLDGGGTPMTEVNAIISGCEDV
jgi:hypothetical protein